MLALGSAGMARELFWVPGRELSLVRMGVCLLLILGPTVTWAWLRARIPPEQSSPSPVPSSRLPGS